jgi:hypothetical protein
VHENTILTSRVYFHLLSLAATKEHREEDELCDPRGYRNGTKSVPYRHCQYCCCPCSKCHNQVYGKFCELMVVNAVARPGVRGAYYGGTCRGDIQNLL